MNKGKHLHVSTAKLVLQQGFRPTSLAKMTEVSVLLLGLRHYFKTNNDPGYTSTEHRADCSRSRSGEPDKLPEAPDQIVASVKTGAEAHLAWFEAQNYFPIQGKKSQPLCE